MARVDTIGRLAKSLSRRPSVWAWMLGRGLAYFLLALVLVFLALVLVLVFLPELHPHVLHIFGPFIRGLDLLVGPRYLSPRPYYTYRLQGRPSISNFSPVRFLRNIPRRGEFSFDKTLRTMNNTSPMWFGRSGGTGRRAGFKIPSWQQGEGSTPSFGNSRVYAGVYCSLPARLVYSSSFQPDGRSMAAKTIFTKSPATKGYSPTVRTLVPAPIRQQSQNSPQA
jgi:hypothetical protein